MSEYFLRFDPEEIRAEQMLRIDYTLNTINNLSKSDFNKLIEGFEDEFNYEEYVKWYMKNYNKHA